MLRYRTRYAAKPNKRKQGFLLLTLVPVSQELGTVPIETWLSCAPRPSEWYPYLTNRLCLAHNCISLFDI